MAEMIEVLDAQGQKTGEVKTKAEIHALGLWHRTAHAWIISPEGQLLLQRRGPTMDTYPNCWDISSAGHISAGETTLIGAQREITEELGLTIQQSELEFLFTVQRESFHKEGKYINREFQDVFLIEKEISLESLKAQASEVTEFQYLPWQEVQKRVQAEDPELVPHPDEYLGLFKVLLERY